MFSNYFVMSLCTSYFDTTQLTMLVTGIFFFLLSIVSHIGNKQKLTLIFLGLTAFFIFCFAALLDPFLNLWDERIHALVAKNLMHHPFMPTLYDDPVVDMAYNTWDKYHIWLHKQPLFLWQIALSFKIFGVSEFTLRLPSVVLGTVLVLITYRSGKLLYNHQVGFIAALLLITAIYIIELVSGRLALEHNDFSFLVYISLSIWAFIEYYFTKRKIWIYFIGLFAGMAILCKWLAGLLVYSGWFVLRISGKKFRVRENADIMISLLVTLLIALPWQILIMIWYPSEAHKAYAYNTLHFFAPVEGHDGSFLYHFDMFGTIYGPLSSFLIVPSFLVFYKKIKDKDLALSLLSMIMITYLFFSIAATKMQSFTIIVAMIIFIAFATLIDEVLNYFYRFISKKGIRNTIFTVAVIAILSLRFNIELLQENHTTWKASNQHTPMMIHNKRVFQSLDLPHGTVLFNVKGVHFIDAMFYTGLPAYNFIPTLEQYLDIKSKGRSIAIFQTYKTEIPDYLANDSTIIVIKEELKGYE